MPITQKLYYLGNLFLLPSKVNSSLGAKKPHDKKQTYI